MAMKSCVPRAWARVPALELPALQTTVKPKRKTFFANLSDTTFRPLRGRFVPLTVHPTFWPDHRNSVFDHEAQRASIPKSMENGLTVCGA